MNIINNIIIIISYNQLNVNNYKVLYLITLKLFFAYNTIFFFFPLMGKVFAIMQNLL